jgi:hypothetical protein
MCEGGFCFIVFSLHNTHLSLFFSFLSLFTLKVENNERQYKTKAKTTAKEALFPRAPCTFEISLRDLKTEN